MMISEKFPPPEAPKWGTKFSKNSNRHLKWVSLELEGKSLSIVFPDADLGMATQARGCHLFQPREMLRAKLTPPGTQKYL
jgi:hypothetical protein